MNKPLNALYIAYSIARNDNWNKQHCISQHKFIKNKGTYFGLPDDITTLFSLGIHHRDFYFAKAKSN